MGLLPTANSAEEVPEVPIESPSTEVSFSCPGFEGFEKRLEVEFSYAEDSNDVMVMDGGRMKKGLRSIPRSELDAILDAARCTIVSSLCNAAFDSYVLSESSLFVYPNTVVLKTCGTTKLLLAIPLLLESAAKVGMKACRCKYTRGTFMFPFVQPFPHNSFDDEVNTLERFFGHLGGGVKSAVMGDADQFPNWHVYIADGRETTTKRNATYTLEMCMTQLDRKVANQFFTSSGFKTASAVTVASGINGILPGSSIDDFSFEPCGYSMNGIEQDMHSTIHITPEDGFSYASFECMGYDDAEIALPELIDRVLKVFKPGRLALALHLNAAVYAPSMKSVCSWLSQLPSVMNYHCDGTSRQVFPHGACTVFHTFSRGQPDFAPVLPLPVVEKLHQKSAITDICSHDETDSAKGVVEVIEKAAPTLVGIGSDAVDNHIRSVLANRNGSESEEAFYVMDVAEVLRLWSIWREELPRVRPFYAVKCNPEPMILQLLAALGSGFDVASKAEIEAVMAAGVEDCGANMIFANPCKLPSHMAAAAKTGVAMTTFDSVSELVKLKKYYPGVKAVLRLRSDDRNARCPLGVKYGAELEECEELLQAAMELGVHVAGVAFHVGSGATDPFSYADGISAAKKVFEMAEKMGLPPMTILDIGGGFVSKGGLGVDFSQASAAINSALDDYFPAQMGVSVIGEPGRYFAESPFTLAAHVFGTRVRGKGQAKRMEYWINDGIYGSMNCLLFDHAVLSARALPVATAFEGCLDGEGFEGENGNSRMFESTVFGPTCDGLDTVLRNTCLPQLQCGDWLVFPRMGAYTQAAGSSFNGFRTDTIKTHYVFSCGSHGHMGFLKRSIFDGMGGGSGSESDSDSNNCGNSSDSLGSTFFDDDSTDDGQQQHHFRGNGGRKTKSGRRVFEDDSSAGGNSSDDDDDDGSNPF
eukprot:TRINITY_DN51_c0_g1_i1.p1 TRINITY_DN51_c0_g1~~TRINITY_DN51_c0_g1_i1.p1  ORF type:complete len:926 (+),score=276.50 TRINITY_DN51_c0_g1_i1:532-3309(+)